MKDFQIVGFLVSISSIMFFISILLKMEKCVDRYNDGSMTLEEFKNNRKAFIMSSIFSLSLVFIGGMLFLVGF